MARIYTRLCHQVHSCKYSMVLYFSVTKQKGKGPTDTITQTKDCRNSHVRLGSAQWSLRSLYPEHSWTVPKFLIMHTSLSSTSLQSVRRSNKIYRTQICQGRRKPCSSPIISFKSPHHSPERWKNMWHPVILLDWPYNTVSYRKNLEILSNLFYLWSYIRHTMQIWFSQSL